MPGRKIGEYQILGKLGEGAHSTIHHVRCSADAKHYALKVVPIDRKEDRKFLEQARHEYRVAQLLDHPNLIKVYTLEIQRDWLFRIRKVHLLIEYVNGKTLDLVPRLRMPQLVQIFERLARAMTHMHRRGVYHADLKPNNILLSKTGEVKIIDYGLAWIKGESKERVQGTPEYMAPEQVQQSIANDKTDIYNLGATMYRMVTGKLPPNTLASSEGMRMNAKTFQGLLTPVQELNPETPTALCELIHKCLAYRPQERPERVSEVQGTLDHLADEIARRPRDRLEAMGSDDG